MEKQILLQELKKISDHYFNKKDYISAGQINLAMDVIEDYDGVLPQADVIKPACECKEPIRRYSPAREEYYCEQCQKSI